MCTQCCRSFRSFLHRHSVHKYPLFLKSLSCASNTFHMSVMFYFCMYACFYLSLCDSLPYVHTCMPSVRIVYMRTFASALISSSCYYVHTYVGLLNSKLRPITPVVRMVVTQNWNRLLRCQQKQVLACRWVYTYTYVWCAYFPLAAAEPDLSWWTACGRS